MRKRIVLFLFCLFLLLSFQKVQAAAVFVQSAQGAGDGATATTGSGLGSNNFPFQTTSGNSIVCAVRGNNQANTIVGLTDNKGNTYNVAVSKINHTSGQRWLAIYYAHNIVGGSGHTVTATINSSSFDTSIICHEVSGLVNSTPDVTASDNAEAGTAVDCPAITPSSSGEYLFGSVTVTANTDTFSPETSSNSWVEAGEINFAVDSDIQAQYLVSNSTSPVTARWTQSGTGGSMCAVAGFAASSGSSTPPPPSPSPTPTPTPPPPTPTPTPTPQPTPTPPPPSTGTPSISSVSGSLTNGSSLTITGSNFGSKSTAQPMKFDNFEQGSNNNPITGWDIYGTLPTYSNIVLRPNSILSERSNFVNGDWHSAFGYLNGVPNAFYFDAYYYYDAPPYSRNHKIYRTYTDGFGNYPSLFYNVYCGTNEGVLESGAGSTIWNNPGASYFSRKWSRLQGYLVQSSPGQSNGTAILWVDGVRTTNVVNAFQTRGAGVNPWNVFMFGEYLGHDAETGCPAVGDVYTYWDNVYFDNTLAHVEIRSTPTWSNTTTSLGEIQLPTTWSGNSISFTANTGAFTAGQTAYVYVMDSNGNVNSSGYPLIIGSGGTPPPPPTPVPGDLNLDHVINSLDWSIMNSQWFTSNSQSDLRVDGQVNSLDFAILSNNWGRVW